MNDMNMNQTYNAKFKKKHKQPKLNGRNEREKRGVPWQNVKTLDLAFQELDLGFRVRGKREGVGNGHLLVLNGGRRKKGAAARPQLTEPRR